MTLAAANLSVALSGREIVHGASLSLAPGEVVGLLGPNGAGKSTLMRALAGHLAYQGSVSIQGRDASLLAANQRARLVAHLPQARLIAWPLSVANLVALGRQPWLGFGQRMNAADEALCAAAMDLMDVAHLSDRPATELSGGEQARVLAARAVAQDTPFLLADEPVAGLDPAHQIMMMMSLRKLAASQRGILISLHDLSLASRWCDRLLLMMEGRIAAEGAPREVMTTRNLSTIFGVTAQVSDLGGGLVLTPTGLAAAAT